MLCIGLLYMAAAAIAAAVAAQYCSYSTTKRMPRYYYHCVREAGTLISLASPPFGLRASYAHTRTMVGCTVLAVFLTQKSLPPNPNVVYICGSTE